ncbi:fatty acyl-CoA reductase wat-like isoform X1 [Andrena cerasifolii]|uniref:fatty acyl-CoA reductase wat-like isoform X1 n=1 Tax=Andrena cerasifolii TaxID=2819439 RepID=UPI004037686E
MYLFKASGTGSELYAVEIHPSLNSHRRIAISPSVKNRYTIKMTSEGSNAYIDDISYQCDESPVLNPEKSKIAEWFAHTNVLITGGTGFLGKLIVEKLLRSCPGITTIYMIVRPKKGKSSEQRFKENFEDAVYDRLRREQPNFLNKLIMVDGDAMQEDYGLSPETKTMLMNTNIIFHAAATVRFDEKMRLAVSINVKSTRYLLLFAKQMPHLKAFVHVSTAFSNCIHKNIDEIHYKPPIDGDKLISLLDIFDDEQLEQMTPMLLKNWPNMYIFSKAVGESIVAKYSEGIPTCIVRPSIVISTAEEPLIGWINNVYGAMGVMLGGILGVLHTLHCIPENAAEMIPADYVVSTTIAAAWGTSNMKSAILDKDANIAVDERIPIYNSVSSCQNPIAWGTFLKIGEVFVADVPSIRNIWYPMLILNRHLILHKICVFFLHTLPAIIVDTFAYIVGRKPMLLDTYKKIQKFTNVLHHFSIQEWNFSDDNVQKLWQGLNSTDQGIFKFNIKNLDWNDYFYGNIRGIRMYLIKESPNTVEAARRRYQKLKIAHYTLITLTFLLMLWVTVHFLSFLWSLCPLAH